MTKSNKPRLLYQVKQFIRVKFYSLRTEGFNGLKFIFSYDKKYPIEIKGKGKILILPRKTIKMLKMLSINIEEVTNVCK